MSDNSELWVKDDKQARILLEQYLNVNEIYFEETDSLEYLTHLYIKNETSIKQK